MHWAVSKAVMMVALMAVLWVALLVAMLVARKVALWVDELALWMAVMRVVAKADVWVVLYD